MHKISLGAAASLGNGFAPDGLDPGNIFSNFFQTGGVLKRSDTVLKSKISQLFKQLFFFLVQFFNGHFANVCTFHNVVLFAITLVANGSLLPASASAFVASFSSTPPIS